MLLKAGKGSGGAGGFGDREGRGRREEDPDAGRYIDPGTATFLCFSRLSFFDSNYQLPQILFCFLQSNCCPGLTKAMTGEEAHRHLKERVTRWRFANLFCMNKI